MTSRVKWSAEEVAGPPASWREEGEVEHAAATLKGLPSHLPRGPGRREG